MQQTQPAQLKRPMARVWAGPWPLAQVLVSIAIFLYTLSLYKIGRRDPLGTDLGFQGPLEALLVGVSFLLTLAACLVRRVRLPGLGVFLLLGYTLFALLSSSQSYWPPLSIVKALLLMLTVVMASFACSAIGPQAVLARFYWSMLLLIGSAILIGVLVPQSFPLFQVDSSERSRLWIFATHPGVVADFTAMLLLLGMLMRPQPPLAAQAALLLVNIACGGRSSSLVLISFLLLAYIVRSRRSIISVLNRGCLLFVALSVVLSVGLLVVVLVEPLRLGALSVLARTVAESGSVNGRTAIWSFTLDLLRENILLGYGPEGARAIFLRTFIWSSNAHSGYLEIVLTAGWLGGACFFLGWLLIARRALHLPTLRERAPALLAHLYLALLGVIGGLIAPQFTIGLFILVILAYLTRRSELYGNQSTEGIDRRPLV